jgi:hypothetical protein
MNAAISASAAFSERRSASRCTCEWSCAMLGS